MSDPKRIYIDDHMMRENRHLLANGSPALDTEYIRADIVAGLVEAIRKRLEVHYAKPAIGPWCWDVEEAFDKYEKALAAMDQH